jgi:hypothetical protein
MTAYPVWKLLVLVALIVLPGSLLLLPLILAHRKLARRALVPLPQSIDGHDPDGHLRR